LRSSISVSPVESLALRSSISLAASAEAAPGRARVRVVVVGAPAVESLFAAVVVGAAAVRVAVVRVAEDVAVVGLAVAVVRAPVVPMVEVRVVPMVRFSGAGFPGLLVMALVLLDAVEMVDFFSSSLALTLGRLRWLDTVEEVVGRRTVEVDVVGGRVGGLLRPPVARTDGVAVAVFDAAVVATPGRRAVVAVVPVAGRLAKGVALASPFLLASADAAAIGLGAAGCSEGTASTVSLSAMMQGRQGWTI
jgi:hypothetical protein